MNPEREILPFKPAGKLSIPDTCYGNRRLLIEAQRKWMAESSGSTPYTPQPTAPAQDHDAAIDAFDRWIEGHIIINQMNNLVIANDWVNSYVNYCDSHGYPKLELQPLLSEMGAYAKKYNFTLATNGDLLHAAIKV
jgi:hypothetical protein